MRLSRARHPRSQPEITDPALAAFDRRVKDLYLQNPSEQTVSAHIDMVLAEVRKPAAGAHFKIPLGRRLRASLTVRIAAATAVFLGATSSLAYAGALPSAMQDAVSSAAAKAGFELPTAAQGRAASGREDGAEGSDNGKSVKDAVLDTVRSNYDSGREKGEAVSDVASQNRRNEDHPNGSGVDGAATDDPPASGRPDDPQDQSPKNP